MKILRGPCLFFPGSKEATKSAWCNDIMIIVLIVYSDICL